MSHHRRRLVPALLAAFSIFTALVVATPVSAATYSIVVSTAANRSNPVPLDGQSVSGDIYVFTTPTTDVSRVRFWLDNPNMSGTPYRIENGAPFDLNGTASNGNAIPYPTTGLADGSHSIAVKVTTSTGTIETAIANFVVSNGGGTAALDMTPSTLSFSVPVGGTTPSKTIDVASTGGTASFSVSDNAPWLSVTPTSGSTPTQLSASVDASGLSAGTYTATITATAPGFTQDTVAVTLQVTAVGGGGYSIMVSTSANRSNPVPLDGQSVSGDIYVFTTPTTDVSRVRFWLDNPNMSGPPFRNESGAPFDFNGTAKSGDANPYPTTGLADGSHSIAVKVTTSTGTIETAIANFVVSNGGGTAALDMTPSTLSFNVPVGGTTPSKTIDVASTGGTASFSVSDNAPWLSVSPTTGSTPTQLSASVDASGLSAGTYTATITATAPGFTQDTVAVTLQVTAASGCSPLPCNQWLIDLPYELDFLNDHGGIVDANGVGTGLRYVQDPSNGSGYLPSNLVVDAGGTGTLNITTTRGLAFQSSDSQDNALGVGVDAPSQITLISATLKNPPAGTGNQEQAGLWWGIDEDNYIKLAILSSGTGTKIQMLMEQNGVQVSSRNISVSDLSGSNVTLRFRTDPTNSDAPSVTGSFSVNGGAFTSVRTDVVPGAWFSFDAAGIDPEIGTRTFTGIFASHRNASSPLVYRFDDFLVSAEQSGGGGGSSTAGNDGISFDRKTFVARKPTSMVWGPDGRLYFSEFMGVIHALTLDADNNVTNDQVITTLGQRLTLGLAMDPASTPTNVILWVSHSSPSLNAGQVNSSTVTRLSGPNLTTRTDVITGLPRALANHAINSIHFGPDGRLYIAHGGNTGAGAPNTGETEFGDRAEQPLSAAFLVADVNAAGFDGTCNNETNQWGTPPCDVKVYADGMRNMYDFIFHSNGQIYGPENGLGVDGTFPPTTTPPCRGFGDLAPWDQGGDNPGDQVDTLLRIRPGRYYGHPNPYRSLAGSYDNGTPLRDECVFFDGHWQGVAPEPNYEPAMFVLGKNRSSNGIIEYASDAFCSTLQHDILLSSYSKGDDITRVQLSPDGTEVVGYAPLVAGFNDPLPLVEGPAGSVHEGTIYVGEFGGNVVSALTPQDTGCWSTAQDQPANVLDAGSGVIDGKLYSVAGKNATAHISAMYVYDPTTDSWTTGPALPGPAVENPAAAVHGGKLYVFGGSTAAFAGAVTNAAVFDPGTNQWTTLAPMPSARAGATAKWIPGDDKIYVVGGMDGNGASLDTVVVYDVSANTWSTGAPLSTRRDNPGSAVLNGKLYVFGGRTRNADGSAVANNLATVEVFDPSTGAWAFAAPMPTGRRTMAVGTLNGRAQLIAGERRADGTAFSTVEEYDPLTDTWRTLIPIPTGRHGMAYGTIGTKIYAAGGATDSAAGSATDVLEVFSFNTG